MKNADDEEGNFLELFLLWIIATVCIGLIAMLAGFAYVLFLRFI